MRLGAPDSVSRAEREQTWGVTAPADVGALAISRFVNAETCRRGVPRTTVD